MKKNLYVIPAHNEAENVRVLIPMIFEQSAHIPSHELHILVVDDNLPDDTWGALQSIIGYTNGSKMRKYLWTSPELISRML